MQGRHWGTVPRRAAREKQLGDICPQETKCLQVGLDKDDSLIWEEPGNGRRCHLGLWPGHSWAGRKRKSSHLTLIRNGHCYQDAHLKDSSDSWPHW